MFKVTRPSCCHIKGGVTITNRRTAGKQVSELAWPSQKPCGSLRLRFIGGRGGTKLGLHQNRCDIVCRFQLKGQTDERTVKVDGSAILGIPVLFYPTGPFKILELEDQENGEFYIVAQEQRETSMLASKGVVG